MIKNALAAGLALGAMVAAHPALAEPWGGKFRNIYEIECRDASGAVKWTERLENLVTTAGATDVLAKYFKGAAYTAAWFVGLYGGTGTLAAGDTMASHAGWTEFIAYSETVRQTLTLGTPAAGSVDNSASKAVFTINGAGGTVLGAFVNSDSTKSGTTGTLFGEGAFSASRTVVATDTITVSITLTMS